MRLRDHYAVIYFSVVVTTEKEGLRMSMYKTATDIVAWAEVDDATSEEVESVIAEVGL